MTTYFKGSEKCPDCGLYDRVRTNDGYVLCARCSCKAVRKNEKSALDGQVAGNHYQKMAIQPAQFIHANGIGFLEGCVIKRVCRFRDKAGREDLEKAIHELQLLIELEYGGGE